MSLMISKRSRVVLTCALLASALGLRAQVVQVPVQIERLDPRINAIVPANAILERVTTGFNWVEGPIWMPQGFLLFADIPTNSIRKVTADGVSSVFMQPSGYTDPTPFQGHEPGSNGATLDPDGRLVLAGNGSRSVFRLEPPDPHGKKTILADSYQGKRINSPNDVIFRSDGLMYFTDPPYGLETENDKDPKKELAVNGLYLVRHAGQQKSGAPPDESAIQLLVSDLPRPNGIALSPDEKVLYVNNTEPQKIWLRFRVEPDGTLSGRTIIADATSDKRPGAPDGMKVDSTGNLFSAGPGGIWIFAPDGTHLGTIDLPEHSSNVAWGGADLQTLYITANHSVYRIRLSSHGIPLAKTKSAGLVGRRSVAEMMGRPGGSR
jgi:gluconolactonase